MNKWFKKIFAPKWTHDDAWLLYILYLNVSEGDIHLKDILHKCDAYDRSYIPFEKLREGLQKLINADLVIIKDRRFNLTCTFNNKLYNIFQSLSFRQNIREVIRLKLEEFPLEINNNTISQIDFLTKDYYNYCLELYFKEMKKL